MIEIYLPPTFRSVPHVLPAHGAGGRQEGLPPRRKEEKEERHLKLPGTDSESVLG